MSFEADVLHRIREVLGNRDAFVPLHAPEFHGREWEFVKDCLDTGWVSSVGSYVDQFEEHVARACGTRHAVAVVNGTAALQIALVIAGVEQGEEVLLPALTFVATANAVVHAGAVPHFVDCHDQTLGLDPVALGLHLDRIAIRKNGVLVNRETGRRLAAIVPMHTFGRPVDMDALAEVAAEWGLPIVEDAAEALGSRYKGRACGGLGMVAALSFNGNKIITTGGGGAIATDDAELARRAKHLTTTAKQPHRWAFNHDEIGYNYRMPNLNAALGCAQFEQLEARLEAKRKLQSRYAAAFETFDGARVMGDTPETEGNNWLVTLRLADRMAEKRDILLDYLNEAGVMTRPVWTLMHRLPIHASNPRAPLPVSERLEGLLLNLPSSANLARS